MKDIKEWANQNKLKALFILCILSVVIINYLHFLRPHPVKPPVQKEETKIETKKEQVKQVKKQQALKVNKSNNTKTTTRTYDKNTGNIVKEVVKESATKTELVKDTEIEKAKQQKVEEKQDTKVSYKKPYTGLTMGIVVTPSGSGITAGATLAEIAPITASAQVGVLLQPQHSIVAGLSVNGEVATNLEAGVGVYLGPQTSFGYTPVPGLPVSIQPGITLQYRF
jgi:hypothetical protein